MLKGLRWPLLLLVGAIILFGAAILLQPEPADPTEATAPSATQPPAAPDSAPTPLPPQDNPTPVVFREGVVGSVERLNPLFVSLNPVDRDIASLIFEGLVGINAYGEYVPALAHDWTISSDSTDIVLRLRPDVLWQDGIPFTSADVAVTVALLQAPDSPLPSALTEFWRTVELDLLDEHTVRFRLAQPLASFLDYLRIGILPAHIFDGLSPSQLPDHPFNLAPVGTGPYQLERLTGDERGVTSVSLRVAPAYRQRSDGQIGYELERVIFRMYDSQSAALEALRTGEIDALGGVSSADLSVLQQNNAIQTYIALAPTVSMILFNWESSHTQAFRDQRVRLALVEGADRAGLVNRHFSGQAVPADSPLIPGSWAYAGPISWPDFDPIRAMNALSQVTFVTPEPTPEVDATPLSEAADSTPVPTEEPPAYDFRLLGSDNPAQAALLEDLAGQWRQLGLNVSTEIVPSSVLLERLNSGDFDTALVELTYSPSADPDPYVFWHQGQSPDGQNYAAVNDRRSSELLERARRDPNGIHRREYYADFQRVFANRVLAMPLYYPVYIYAVSPGLAGVELGYLSTFTDRFGTIAGWRREFP